METALPDSLTNIISVSPLGVRQLTATEIGVVYTVTSDSDSARALPGVLDCSLGTPSVSLWQPITGMAAYAPAFRTALTSALADALPEESDATVAVVSVTPVITEVDMEYDVRCSKCSPSELTTKLQSTAGTAALADCMAESLPDREIFVEPPLVAPPPPPPLPKGDLNDDDSVLGPQIHCDISLHSDHSGSGSGSDDSGSYLMQGGYEERVPLHSTNV
jgi:hypothetical protein